ncbi:MULTISPECIES: helix-turn-helix domain-containing protein [Rahnella]|jgi:HTH-type transcriptional regulator/antitoxin HipB|uniref:Transcriptional regulator n=1 Tax=Rahnella variigena TaxID=574964 RepID=A0ABX9PUK8_9GAMM|nr:MULTISPECIES: helix-turn-helix domain-containing protein [Rahnella]MDH2895332.1 helix-turn-helix domain-containing protein [Rahnella variigena]RJT54420.1 helix-turn-helix domain-containing protein [Rahnella variigena]RKF68014.1 transcriptional regulator [Rahnella variigena]RYJ11957.1 transcriptional regulator [Rahnella variigena]TCQ85560.1 Xre family transcriptional regulator [Rahnella sp. JUb53]
MKTLKQLPELLKQRRIQLDLNQKDMLMRIGMSQQQYQRIEAGADPRLSTLLRILEGMDLEMMLVPRQRVQEIEALLEGTSRLTVNESQPDSWNDLLHDLDD